LSFDINKKKDLTTDNIAGNYTFGNLNYKDKKIMMIEE